MSTPFIDAMNWLHSVKGKIEFDTEYNPGRGWGTCAACWIYMGIAAKSINERVSIKDGDDPCASALEAINKAKSKYRYEDDSRWSRNG